MLMYVVITYRPCIVWTKKFDCSHGKWLIVDFKPFALLQTSADVL